MNRIMSVRRKLLAGLGIMGVLSAPYAQASVHQWDFPSLYDEQIQQASKRWWIDYPDWLSWKAQLYQESKLDPNAKSSVGAQGLAQFMDPTWQDISRELGYGTVSRILAGPAIDGGAYYMAKLRKAWSAPRSDLDRQELAQASYNAGTGSLLRAQSKCGNPNDYRHIILCLDDITGTENARQTTNYVVMIAKWRSEMLGK